MSQEEPLKQTVLSQTACVGRNPVNAALSLEALSPPPPRFCLEVEIPSSFISLFLCLKLHESFLAVGNLNAFRPKWKISEMLDYLFLKQAVDLKLSVATSGFSDGSQ